MSKSQSTEHFVSEKRDFFILNHLVGVFYKKKKKIVTEKKKKIFLKYLATFSVIHIYNEMLSKSCQSS
jgi:hypothetical protein